MKSECVYVYSHIYRKWVFLVVSKCRNTIIMSTHWGVDILFLLFPPSGVPLGFPDILGNSSYPIFTKFGMQVYWVNSLYGIAFGDDSSIAN